MAAKLFFSYSHADEALRDQLEVQLAMLKRGGLIEAWHDRRITAGTPIGDAISTRLEDADIVLLLVSPDFLASDYCYEREMARALERHRKGSARVIPVILRPCDWHDAPFGELLAAPEDGKPITRWADSDEAFLVVVSAIRRAIAEMTGAAPATSAPAAARAVHEPAASMVSEGPRSSNLRLRKHFTEADKDAFLEESFEYIARYFENSLTELGTRNSGIEGRYRRLDATHFTAVIYRDGVAESGCRIWLGETRSFVGGIAYSANDTSNDNSYNENLSIVETDQALVLRPIMGMAYQGGERDPHLSQEGAAEFFWNKLIEPLQR